MYGLHLEFAIAIILSKKQPISYKQNRPIHMRRLVFLSSKKSFYFTIKPMVVLFPASSVITAW